MTNYDELRINNVLKMFKKAVKIILHSSFIILNFCQKR